MLENMHYLKLANIPFLSDLNHLDIKIQRM